jgi:hypothetical protein
MRYSVLRSWICAAVCSLVFLTGCASHRVSHERPSDSAFLLFDSCSDFHGQYHRWPNDFVELSAFVQQSGGKSKLGHYDRVEFKSLQDGRLEIDAVSDGRSYSGTLTPSPKK